MAWLILVVSGAFEAVWAVALDRSEGFSKLVPTLVFFVACAISMGGLAWALKTLPVGTGYAVWVGVGAGLTVVYSLVTGQEPFSVLKLLFLAMIVGGIIGLKAVS
ncbi:DMT family transporter [Corynebacterium confusum]|uniref:DMT family transporter n=1 Tax=Corynebacterium confusum TaxID=71254 RepID=UPI0025B314B8|nr:SMR family transporter [Corynebacterium confusum]WJY88875.1 Quaternary ammonium compound-resistance protein SugE [Corynebacterium confusum]